MKCIIVKSHVNQNQHLVQRGAKQTATLHVPFWDQEKIPMYKICSSTSCTWDEKFTRN